MVRGKRQDGTLRCTPKYFPVHVQRRESLRDIAYGAIDRIQQSIWFAATLDAASQKFEPLVRAAIRTHALSIVARRLMATAPPSPHFTSGMVCPSLPLIQ